MFSLVLADNVDAAVDSIPLERVDENENTLALYISIDPIELAYLRTDLEALVLVMH